MSTQLQIVDFSGQQVELLTFHDTKPRMLEGALASRGYSLNTRCGRRGWCRGCAVELVAGILGSECGSVVGPAEVQACNVSLMPGGEKVVIRIPQHARLEARPQVGDIFVIDAPVVLDPPWPVRPGVADTAFAVDIGTTTVAVALVDLVNGEVLARAGDFNAQIRFGDNVITRIVGAGTPGILKQMQAAVVKESIAPLLTKVCAEANLDPRRIVGGIAAGNTTMLHLLTGEDPAGLGVVPFTPRFLESRSFTVESLGLEVFCSGQALPKTTPLVLLPGFSAYVGADLAAGVHATGMMCDEAPSLLVDIGTNGEIVLQSGGKLYACATAAGPAFEGAGLLAGTRAQTGAISHVRVAQSTFQLSLETIGGTEAARAPGLCGTAYVDFLATARQAGLVMPSGRFAPAIWNQLPAAMLAESKGGRTLKLANELCISEADIASLLQAKAAIGAGIETLMHAAGLRAQEIGKLYLAGGFGLYIDVDNAIAIGLLPGFERKQVQVVGNTSLGGALLAALDRTVVAELEKLRQRIGVVELNREPGFEDCYLDHLALP